MKRTNRKLLTTLLTCTACVGLWTASLTPSYGAYKLSSEVKTATPALLEASEIGVRVYENKAMADVANKDAILVMSFGTTFKETREKTIEATVADIQKAHPTTKVVMAFTSHIIIDRIKANEGIDIPTPEQALSTLKKDGYTRVSLVSLDVIPGLEYGYNTAVFKLYKKDFKKMTLGLPLMYWMGQENQRNDIQEFLGALQTELPSATKRSAILLMAHGTPDPANAYYPTIQANIKDSHLQHVFVYTVEGWPRLENIMPMLKKEGIKEVTLIPMMMVAGDHANNDMAGPEPTSHKSILEKEGFKVNTYLHGLGENKDIRNMYVERANEAFTALTSETIHESQHQK